MKRILNFILWVLIPLSLLAEPTADEVLTQFLQKVEQQTLVTSFTITVTEQATQPMSYTGSISMRGDKFLISMFGNEGAYDGRTLYMYAEDVNELSMSNPTQEELVEANPILFAKALRRQSKVRFSGTNRDSKVYAVDLIPNNQSAGVQHITIKINKQTLLPVELSVKEGKQLTVIKFVSAKYESTIPKFTISKPGAFVNDLR